MRRLAVRTQRLCVALGLLPAVLVGCGDAAGLRTPEDHPCVAARVPFPDEEMQTGNTGPVHDPEIVVDGDAYYVYSTKDGVPIRRSRDLLSWEYLGPLFQNQVPAWARSQVPGVESPWAPGIGHFNGRYHLYYSLSTFGSPRSVIGLTTNVTLDPASPGYAWVDHGKVLESFPGDGYNAIDAAVVEDGEGGLWLVWGSWWDGIKMRALDRSTGFLSDDDPTLHALARRPLVHAVEGPYVIHRPPYYYLFVAFDHCCQGATSTYNVRVGRSTAVTGPYVDRDGVPMLDGGGSRVLDGYGRFRGPGHASALARGAGHLLVHHYYDAESNGFPRLQIRPLVWDDAGWPLAGLAFDGTPPGPAPAGVQPVGRWGYWVGGEAAHAIELRGDGIALACDREGLWSYQAPVLAVEWAASGSPARVDRSFFSSDGNSLVGRTPDGSIVRGYRLAGGA